MVLTNKIKPHIIALIIKELKLGSLLDLKNIDLVDSNNDISMYKEYPTIDNVEIKKESVTKFFIEDLHWCLDLLTDLINISNIKIPQNKINLFLTTLKLSVPGTPISKDKYININCNIKFDNICIILYLYIIFIVDF